MKTSVLISGNARTFKQCYPNLRFYVFNRLWNPHFFVSVADDAQAKDMEQLREDFKEVHIEYEPQPTLPEPPEAQVMSAGWANSSPPQAILRQFWHLQRVWQFCQEKGGDDAEVVVRCRPDLWFRKMHMPLVPPAGRNKIFVPWWGGYGGVNDRFAIMSGSVAPAYFNVLGAMPRALKAGVPFHPETLLSWALPIVSRTLRAEFCIARLPNEQNEIKLIEPDIRPGDMADYLADLQSMQ